MKNQTILVIILLILLLGLGAYNFNDKVIKPHYQQQGWDLGYAYVINRIDTTATIPLIDRNDNNTLKWISINDLFNSLTQGA